MTTIAISEETKERITLTFLKVTAGKKTGRFSSDTVINRLLDEIDSVHKSKSAQEYLKKTLIKDVEEVLNAYK